MLVLLLIVISLLLLLLLLQVRVPDLVSRHLLPLAVLCSVWKLPAHPLHAGDLVQAGGGHRLQGDGAEQDRGVQVLRPLAVRSGQWPVTLHCPVLRLQDPARARHHHHSEDRLLPRLPLQHHRHDDLLPHVPHRHRPPRV